MAARSDSALIINTKGGGHAFLGLHLARRLLKDGHSVSILNDGDESKAKAKDPYSQYDKLASEGVTISWGNPADDASLPDGPFDIVYDNNGKALDVCKPAIDKYKGKVKHYAFVASAGAYKADDIEPMLVEGDERKASAGHVEVEKYLEEQDLPYTVFQPQYIYGPYTNKDCEQWFVDRIIRDRPVPIPSPGTQLVNLSHVEDLAAMLATVPGNDAAVRQQFNLASDRAITFDGIVKAIGKALGKEPKIVHFNPKDFDKKAFPFRTVHFFCGADKAKSVLGWQPQHNFLGDVEDLVSAYKASGREQKDIDFSLDDQIISAAS
jgi:nucleoside-diphosphate-sugar epimerase